jgi:hypothetical protein
MPKNIYQFKIILKELKPPVWRRTQVPEDYSLYDLHVAIQDSFPWSDYHLNQFYTVTLKERERKYYGFPDPDNDDWQKITLEWEVPIKNIFRIDGDKVLNYDYDFGDNWQHRVELEKILPPKKGVKYPCCLDGRRACPPEDCGGYPGYEDLLGILKNPQNEEYKDMCDWLGIKNGVEYDPEYFNPKEVEFRNPKKELKRVKAGFGVR